MPGAKRTPGWPWLKNKTITSILILTYFYMLYYTYIVGCWARRSSSGLSLGGPINPSQSSVWKRPKEVNKILCYKSVYLHLLKSTHINASSWIWCVWTLLLLYPLSQHGWIEEDFISSSIILWNKISLFYWNHNHLLLHQKVEHWLILWLFSP